MERINLLNGFSGLLRMALLLLMVSACEARGGDQTLNGKAVRIMDGDTFELLLDNRTERVRINWIDAPEKNQAYGNVSKQALAGLIFGKEVQVRFRQRDRHGRILGFVRVNGINVNLRMVETGMAWHFTRYSSDVALAAAEVKARRQRLGLWADPNPVAPWDFRASRRGR